MASPRKTVIRPSYSQVIPAIFKYNSSYFFNIWFVFVIFVFPGNLNVVALCPGCPWTLNIHLSFFNVLIKTFYEKNVRTIYLLVVLYIIPCRIITYVLRYWVVVFWWGRVAHLSSFLCFVFCLSSSCILCAQCWQCLSIVYRHPVSGLPNVDSVSGLFIFILYLVYPMLTVSLDCLSSSSIWLTQCWQCLSIVYLHPVSCAPNVDSVSGLFVFIL